MRKEDKDLIESLEKLTNDDNEAFLNIDWIMKKIMKISDRDIEINKAYRKRELRIKKMNRIIDEDNK